MFVRQQDKKYIILTIASHRMGVTNINSTSAPPHPFHLIWIGLLFEQYLLYYSGEDLQRKHALLEELASGEEEQLLQCVAGSIRVVAVVVQPKVGG